MPFAWTCATHPEHGAFRQDGIAELQMSYSMFLRGVGEVQPRFACPICVSNGQPGFVRPATSTDAARLAA